jgi:hypothetical protein
MVRWGEHVKLANGVIAMAASKSLVALVLFVTVSPAFAQPGSWQLIGEPWYFSILTLAKNKPVQKELAMSAEQSKAIGDLWEVSCGDFTLYSFREDGQKQEDEKPSLQETNKKIEAAMHKILSPSQIARLQQLFLQTQSWVALKRVDVIKKLVITDDQLKKFVQIEAARRRPDGRSFGDLLRLKREDIQRLSSAINERSKATLAAMLAVLTDEQRAKWDEMNGDRLDFSEEPLADAPNATRPADRPEPAKTNSID